MANTVPNQQPQSKQQAAQQPRNPNESGTISVQAHMKIFDPTTRKVYVEGRA